MTQAVLFEPSYSPDEFCAVERISRSQLYEDWRQGRGPRFYYNGRCRRITHSARKDWQARREAEAARETDVGTDKSVPA